MGLYMFIHGYSIDYSKSRLIFFLSKLQTRFEVITDDVTAVKQHEPSGKMFPDNLIYCMFLISAVALSFTFVCFISKPAFASKPLSIQVVNKQITGLISPDQSTDQTFASPQQLLSTVTDFFPTHVSKIFFLNINLYNLDS